MNLRIFLLSLALAFTSGARCAETESAFLERLQGTWIAIGIQVEGKTLTAQEVSRYPYLFVIKGHKLLSQKDGATEKEALIKIDTSVTPYALDTTDLEKGVLEKGIVALKGDQLWFCSAMKDNIERPAAFETEEKSQLIWFQLKRFEKGLGKSSNAKATPRKSTK